MLSETSRLWAVYSGYGLFVVRAATLEDARAGSSSLDSGRIVAGKMPAALVA
jgi:hypothetical protein